jgi:hypothetical protein
MRCTILCNHYAVMQASDCGGGAVHPVPQTGGAVHAPGGDAPRGCRASRRRCDGWGPGWWWWWWCSHSPGRVGTGVTSRSSGGWCPGNVHRDQVARWVQLALPLVEPPLCKRVGPRSPCPTAVVNFSAYVLPCAHGACCLFCRSGAVHKCGVGQHFMTDLGTTLTCSVVTTCSVATT